MIKNQFKIFLLLTALIFAFTSCNKNNSAKDNSSESGLTLKTAVKVKHFTQETKDYMAGKTIVLILGHGYNDEANVSNISQHINYNYGLKTEDSEGLVSVIVYPDDFMVAGKPRISHLVTLLEETNLAGIITIGAPEGLCNSLARLEDNSIKQQLQAMEESSPDTKIEKDSLKRYYPVFSFFQQDDTLGSESTADFVLDYTPVQTELESEQTSAIPDFDVPLLLINAIQAEINCRGPVTADKNLLNYVQKIVGKQKTIFHYNDYETGLKSINHFIFE